MDQRLGDDVDLEVGARHGGEDGTDRATSRPVRLAQHDLAAFEHRRAGMRERADEGRPGLEDAVHLAEQIDSMPNLQLMGLMTMAELTDEEARIQHCFARTREIFEEMKWHKIGGAGLKHLSMGMSNDFEHAIAEGATMLRIGTALFGGKVQDHEEDGE